MAADDTPPLAGSEGRCTIQTTNNGAGAMRKQSKLMACAAAAVLAACGNFGAGPFAQSPFTTTPVAEFNEPWAMAFLPDGRLLVTEKRGALKLYSFETQQTGVVTGVPAVEDGGQGGLGDVVLHPNFAANGLVYLSYAEAGERGTAGAAVARARLALSSTGGGALENLAVIWRQTPKVDGRGHYGHRIAFGTDGFLYISSGERQKFTPAQDMAANLGKIVRLNDDGSVPADNPFAREGGVTAQIWSLGHRNPLGLAFDGNAQLWNIEMGPRGGDELNRVERGANYGYPIVSNGDHYDGRTIPDHPTRPEFNAPAVFWNPSISPSSLMFYSGSEFPQWRGNAFVGGLSSQSLLRIEIGADGAREGDRFRMDDRIRAVEEGPDGAIWLLEDGGRLLKLTARGD
jgi:glucose/arabinose dehydrogenase